MNGKSRTLRNLAELRAISISGQGGGRRLRAIPTVVLAAVTAFAALASGAAAAATPAAAGHYHVLLYRDILTDRRDHHGA